MSYAPGGWGAFLALSRDPANRSQWLAGADVGGLYVSVDDGVSWHTSDGGRSFGFERRLSNHNVVSLAVDARGRVCAATNGNGHQCVQINKDNFAEKSLSIVTS